MDEEAITGIKLKMLEHIAKNPSSASEISKKLKISLPYALTQLNLLEAKKLLKVRVRSDNQVGKPKKEYSLVKEYVGITILGEGFGKRFASNNIDPQMRTYFQFLSIIKEQNQINFSEYYWKFNQYIKHTKAFANLKEKTNGSEFLAITNKEQLGLLREHISKYKTSEGYEIACWVHTEEEIIVGLLNHDEYYIDLMEKTKPMVDKEEVFKRIEEGRNQ